MHIHPAQKKRRPAFTLIELLVVIAMIVVLAALGFLAFTRAKQSARSAADLSQLRSIGTALTSAAGDTGRYPLSQVSGGDWTYWMDEVRAGLDMHYRASDDYGIADAEPFVSQRLNVKLTEDTSDSELRALKHYAAVEAVLPWRANTSGYDGVPVTAIKRPTEIAMLVDASRADQPLMNSHINLWGSFRSRWFEGDNSWAATDNPARANKQIDAEECEAAIDFRNGGKAHVLFVDGHIQRLGPDDFRFKMFTNAY
jgi:prepilin-type N-terminal cleavage/methylation domain-containing protein/prepilin-type processing-associated H-X9-DG protein